MPDARPRPEPVRLILHRRMHAEMLACQHAGFLEGVCHVIDELQLAGFEEAAEAMLARLFVRPGDAA